MLYDISNVKQSTINQKFFRTELIACKIEKLFGSINWKCNVGIHMFPSVKCNLVWFSVVVYQNVSTDPRFRNNCLLIRFVNQIYLSTDDD